jgi:hypothetical protein
MDLVRGDQHYCFEDALGRGRCGLTDEQWADAFEGAVPLSTWDQGFPRCWTITAYWSGSTLIFGSPEERASMGRPSRPFLAASANRFSLSPVNLTNN